MSRATHQVVFDFGRFNQFFPEPDFGPCVCFVTAPFVCAGCRATRAEAARRRALIAGNPFTRPFGPERDGDFSVPLLPRRDAG